ncbi:hypothetical protein SEVIR_1G326050v4 [Setaria viridis]
MRPGCARLGRVYRTDANLGGADVEPPRRCHVGYVDGCVQAEGPGPTGQRAPTTPRDSRVEQACDGCAGRPPPCDD